MKRTYPFVAVRGHVVCHLDGESLSLPVFMGVLKHPSEEQLRGLLIDPSVARKYTREALRKLPWSALRQFPRRWLISCLANAGLPAGRLRALEFMLAEADAT